MAKPYSTKLFRKVLVPIFYNSEYGAALHAALIIAGKANVLLVGIVGIANEESLSAAAVPARHVRKILRDLASKTQVRILQSIHVSHRAWEELIKIVQEEKPDLLVLETSNLNPQDECWRSSPISPLRHGRRGRNNTRTAWKCDGVSAWWPVCRTFIAIRSCHFAD